MNVADIDKWIKQTKEQLKERERKLMCLRTESIQNIINQQCELFQNINTFKVNSNSKTKLTVTISNYKQIIATNNNMINECLMKLYLTLDLWNGVSLNKTKDQMLSYTKYFNTAKNWFDIKKKKILTPEFWIKLFNQLHNFANVSARTYFATHTINTNNKKRLCRLYANTVLFQIINNIFSGEIFAGSSKHKLLISSSVFKDSKPMKQYLIGLHPTLNIDQIMQNNRVPSIKKNLNAIEVKEFVRKQLYILTNESQQQFQECFQYTVGLQSSVGNCIRVTAPVNNIKHVHIKPPTWQSKRNNLVQNNTYRSVHSVDVNSLPQRYSPMQCTSLFRQHNPSRLYNIHNVINSRNGSVNYNNNQTNDNVVLLQLLSVYLSLM